jgi:hypothetical protein
MAHINAGLRTVRSQLHDVKTRIAQVESNCQALQAVGSSAWQEQACLCDDYYAVLRGVLVALEDCAALSATASPVEPVYTELRKVLDAQRVVPIPIVVGALFDAEQCVCCETRDYAGQPAGVILEIISRGYIRQCRDGRSVVVRPAKVIVNLPATSPTKEPE